MRSPLTIQNWGHVRVGHAAASDARRIRSRPCKRLGGSSVNLVFNCPRHCRCDSMPAAICISPCACPSSRLGMGCWSMTRCLPWSPTCANRSTTSRPGGDRAPRRIACARCDRLLPSPVRHLPSPLNSTPPLDDAVLLVRALVDPGQAPIGLSRAAARPYDLCRPAVHEDEPGRDDDDDAEVAALLLPLEPAHLVPWSLAARLGDHQFGHDGVDRGTTTLDVIGRS